jgi:hypothetical protein
MKNKHGETLEALRKMKKKHGCLHEETVQLDTALTSAWPGAQPSALSADKLELFFENPAIHRTPPGQFSVLYLLRRDIKTCLGINPNTGSRIGSQALWPGAMAVLAGIDLLGKFLAGNDNYRGVGKRFTAFLDEYFQPLSSDDSRAIYQLRNALLHSFGLYSEAKDQVYKFALVPAHQPLVQRREGDKYLVDVLTLHSRFESAITCYETDLRRSTSLQAHFNAMFPKYGSIYIG